MKIFTIVLLPCERDLEILDNLKLKFNKEGFRHKISDTTTHAHITLSQGTYNDEVELDSIKSDLINWLKKETQIVDDSPSITKEKRNPNEKVDYENYWIALTFENKDIIELASKIDAYLVKQNISNTKNYIEKVYRTDPNSITRNIVGDHLNLCNYCKPKKSDEAYNLVKETVPTRVCFDSIGLRYKKGDLAWKFKLGKSSQHHS